MLPGRGFATVCRRRKALALYVRETDYWATDKASEDQWGFVAECLRDLASSLETIGCTLLIAETPSAEDVLKSLFDHYAVAELLCHQETGNGWTFARDKRVLRLCRERGVPVQEFLQNGVVRGRNRPPEKPEHQSFWREWIAGPQATVPKFWRPPTTPPPLFAAPDLSTPETVIRQRGGEVPALGLLESFLNGRCLLHQGYRIEMGSPLHAHEACSRLSPHLSWGSLSTKRAAQATMARDPRPPHGSMMHRNSFHRRLRWRDHFLQKFESLSWMEFRCINPARETLRGWDEESYRRWVSGTTGYPFVDACMRSLNATKWLNFRARAMLVSFASYALNLDWRRFAPHLARTFLDYEPGIHYSQLQMQSGTTLGSIPRIYNPVKQSLEKDPEGISSGAGFRNCAISTVRRFICPPTTRGKGILQPSSLPDPSGGSCDRTARGPSPQPVIKASWSWDLAQQRIPDFMRVTTLAVCLLLVAKDVQR